ncbi:SRPBCC family protein [Sphingobium boeckii]|uniref:Uncharacterized protein YndB with AHSA1/START domain n=1 Tax=Sphingobium boeckii TaxID=1082345 RepID=A0A7W9AL25_9SPHN|nr:SRPBCC domain-containing protein [Sphingobium boeckii]MBB5687645.1 uncharacterized protein YndB with AHSA1/START domain [Sphingobium boeckii]
MKQIIAAIMLLAATPAAAEVKSATDAGFDIAHEAVIAAPPEDVYAALRAPGRWWNKDHSWSGDAQNLWMDAQAGGCFCETLPGKAPNASGSVEHARIIFAQPGKMLRMIGSLGPLQGEAAIGTLTFALKPVDGATVVTLTYVVGGHVRMGMKAIAAPVDGVLGEQLARLAALFPKPE